MEFQAWRQKKPEYAQRNFSRFSTPNLEVYIGKSTKKNPLKYTFWTPTGLYSFWVFHLERPLKF